MEKQRLINKISELKKQKNAVIVAHNYQMDEIQEIADVVGDSLALSRYCASNDADVIVFCGVRFMAESAKILSPQKTVLLPEQNAGCPMADMITADDVRKLREKHPQAVVVCYINSSAEVKAESDICCTSSNAVKVVKSLKEKDIIFIPDQNLGSYIAKKLPEKNIILWEGYCIVHHEVERYEVEKVKQQYPDAQLLAHPECRSEVIENADFVGSTKQIIDYANSSSRKEFIIGTEMGVLYKLKKDNPEKTFHMLTGRMICTNMKKTSLNSVYNALNEMEYSVHLEEDIRKRAKSALDRMLDIK